MSRIITFREICDTLPCRKNFIFLDRVQVIDENRIIGIKCVTLNELHFIGHFPGHPIMPGVLQIEAIAQLGELAVWKKLDPERKGDIYIKSLDRVKFRRPNNPGDRLLIDVKITSVTDDEASLTATVTNNSGLACQGNMVLGVRAKEEPDAIPENIFNEYDKSDKSAMDVNQIMGYIPHRYPFLFVDYVAKINGSHFTGIKNATNSEPIFREYSDGYMVMTGSVQPEIVAQAGCIYMLSSPASKGKIAYFMGIEHSDFTGAVHPGDQMRLEVDIPDNTKRFGKGEGYMLVGDKVISHTNMTFAIVDA